MEAIRTIPTKLYKYQAFTTQTLTNLKLRQIYFSSPIHFNDPFDCRIVPSDRERTNAEWQRFAQWLANQPDLGPSARGQALTADGTPSQWVKREYAKAVTEFLPRFVEHLSTERGVTCFAQRPDNVLLWSHYGGGHKGFCVEYSTARDQTFSYAHPVVYADRVPEVDVMKALMLEDDTDFGFLSMVLTKARCWEYEQEWRVVHMSPNQEYVLKPETITAVYLGSQMSDDSADLICHVMAGSGVRFFKMVADRHTYSLRAEEATYTPYAFPDASLEA